MLCILHQNSHFFHPQTTLIRTFFITFARSCRSVARSLRSLSAPGPLQKTLVARVPCSFRLQGPVYINDCMHHTFNFLNLVCYLLSSSCLQCSTHVFCNFSHFSYKFACRRCYCFCHLFCFKSVACSRCRAPTSRRLCIAYFFCSSCSCVPCHKLKGGDVPSLEGLQQYRQQYHTQSWGRILKSLFPLGN